MADETNYSALFKVPGFGLLLLSSLAARIAVQMFSILIVLFVLETHHSSQLSGLVVLCSQVPGILVSPIAGALLDRGSRLSLMVLDYLFGSSCIALIGVLSLIHHLPTVALILVVSASSITSPLSRVGGKSLYPIMVPRPLWDRSNAVDSGGFVVATVLGPGVAGIAVAVLGPRAALLLPAGVMLLAAVLLIRISLPDTRAVREASVMEDAVAAIRYVWANGVLRMLAGTMTVFNVAGGTLSVALPFVVLRVLHGGSTTVGLLFAVMGCSGFLAGIATGVFGTEGPREAPPRRVVHGDRGRIRGSRRRARRGAASRDGRGSRHGEWAAHRRDVLAPTAGHRAPVVRTRLRGVDEPQLRRQSDRRDHRRPRPRALRASHLRSGGGVCAHRWSVAGVYAGVEL